MAGVEPTTSPIRGIRAYASTGVMIPVDIWREGRALNPLGLALSVEPQGSHSSLDAF